MKNEIIQVFKILHDSLIEHIEMRESTLRFTLSVEFLPSKLNQDNSCLFLEFMNVSDIQYEDWAESKHKYEDLSSIMQFATRLWVTKGEYKDDGKVYMHGHGGNSSDETSIGGTISFNSDNYRIIMKDGSSLSLVELS